MIGEFMLHGTDFIVYVLMYIGAYFGHTSLVGGFARTSVLGVYFIMC